MKQTEKGERKIDVVTTLQKKKKKKKNRNDLRFLETRLMYSVQKREKSNVKKRGRRRGG